MNWLNNTPFRSGFARQRAPDSISADPEACYDSFKEHWQQAFKIIERSHQAPAHDDVLGVVNHLEQMVTLLFYELKNRTLDIISTTSATPCLEYLLSENLLDKVYEWGLRTGRYTNAVRLEQIKMYEVLINISSHQLLVHEPFLRPLLKLLLSCQGECFPDNIVKVLVSLLYQLCVSLVQKVDLLDLFFVSTPNSQNKFIIVSLLINYVHTEGAIGLQARDALLLCMSLSKKNILIGQHSHVCPMLASGLSGLYSALPKNFKIETEDWHRFTPDDVKEIKELALFMNQLEFCNAAAQVAHPIIKRELLDFTYQGFLLPILKPALLQESDVLEQVAAIAYLDLIIRSVTEPGLLPELVRFLLKEKFNDVYLIEILVYRIDSTSRLSLVTLALFETLVDLNCEDIMLELIFKHLRPCSHVMLSQRHLIIYTDTYSINMNKLFSLVPNCCRLNNLSSRSINETSLPTNWNHYGTQTNDTLLGNYHAYLCDARQKIISCRQACRAWSSTYDCTDCYDTDDRTGLESLQSLGDSSGYESLKLKNDEVWKQSSNPPIETSPTRVIPESTQITSSVGLFLDILLEKLGDMLTNNVYVNLHLTGLISRLAIYPQTLLQSYLLNYQLVLQPNVRSIFQVVGLLKQQIDEYMLSHNEPDLIVNQAQHWLFDRESKLINYRRKGTLEPVTPTVSSELVPRPPLDVIPHSGRNSLTNSISSMLKRTSIGSNFLRTNKLNGRESSQPESILMIPNSDTSLDNVALSAILLDEWLKELAAISQEQTIAQLTDFFTKND